MAKADSLASLINKARLICKSKINDSSSIEMTAENANSIIRVSNLREFINNQENSLSK